MKNRLAIVVVAVAALAAATGYGLYRLGMAQGHAMAAPAAAASEDRRILYWRDPMVPNAKFDKPGKSPFMDMQLEPVYADEPGAEPGGVRVDPAVQQNLGMRTAEAVRGKLESRFETVGNVAYDERDQAVVQARANGYIERLNVRAALEPVRAGQALAELYVPDWIAAQEDYLAVRRMCDSAPAGLLQASAQRMRLAGMSDAQVAAVERAGAAQPRLTIVAPIAGVVTELSAREGMTVANGAPLFRLNGLATVWVNAEIPERMARAARPGVPVTVTASAYPGEEFAGRVAAILPQVDAATRTLKARIEVANPRARLVPGMFATVAFAPGESGDAILIPSEAVIRTGRRNVVMVMSAPGRFTPVEVELGRETGGQSEVRRGLEAGQKVVVSGQFLIDSEASLKGVETRLAPGAPK